MAAWCQNRPVSRSVQGAFALVSAPGASRTGNSCPEERERHEYRGQDQYRDDDDEQYLACVVKAFVEGESFTTGACVAEDAHFDFGRARTRRDRVHGGLCSRNRRLGRRQASVQAVDLGFGARCRECTQQRSLFSVGVAQLPVRGVVRTSDVLQGLALGANRSETPDRCQRGCESRAGQPERERGFAGSLLLNLHDG